MSVKNRFYRIEFEGGVHWAQAAEAETNELYPSDNQLHLLSGDPRRRARSLHAHKDYRRRA